MNQRIQEAMRLGFKRVLVPSGVNNNQLKEKNNMEIIEASNLNEAIVKALCEKK